MLSDCHPPGNTRSARPTHCECYFQIPANAEVKSVPVSSLPPAIQQKIRRLGSCNDSDTAPSVICVSQVTKHYFPVSCQPGTFNGAMADMLSPAEHPLYGQSRSPPIRPNLRPMEENIDPAACFVPVKSSKKTASTILELLQAGDLQYMENVLPQRGDFFCFNSSILSIKANVLCMHKNRMYLLPELPAKVSHADANVQELSTRYPGDTTSSSGSIIDISSNTEDEFIFQDPWSEIDDLSPDSDTSVRQDDLGKMTADPCRSVVDKSSVTVIQKDENGGYLAEEIPSTNENTALRPTRFTHSEITDQELITGYPKDTISSPGTGTASNTEDDFSLDYSWSETDDVSPSSDPSVQQDDLGNMTTKSSGNGNRWPGRDKSSVAVIQKDETRCHLEEAIYSKTENPSLGPTHFTHPEREEQELITGYPKDTISSPGTGTASKTEGEFSLDYSWSETDDVSPSSDPSVQQDDLGNMTTESSGNGNRWPGRDKSSVAVIQKDETRCHLEEAIYSKKENPSLGPTHFTHPEREEQIPVRRKQIKRKISSLDNVENVKKTNDLEDSVTNQETKTVHTLSSFSDTLPTSSSASLPVGSPNSPSGQPTSFLPCQQSTGADLFSIPTPQYGVSLIAPIPGGTNAAKATSFSSLAMSKSISRTADSAEPIQCHTIPANKSSLSDSISRPELTSLLDIDETTKAERARRLEERVREMNKIVEDMRMKNQKN